MPSRDAASERFVVERQPDGRWYATYEKDGEVRAGSGLHGLPLDALRWALPVEEPQSDA